MYRNSSVVERPFTPVRVRAFLSGERVVGQRKGGRGFDSHLAVPQF
jgi:hypothetical protein